jgi:hypothetical protein
VAALIKEKTGIDSDLVEGGRGEFTVWVGGNVVAKKDSSGFPEDADVLAAVQHALPHV